jgi:hypothetical protein
MSKNLNVKNEQTCAINLTPKKTKQVLSKMKVPKIPYIALDALDKLNHIKLKNDK